MAFPSVALISAVRVLWLDRAFFGAFIPSLPSRPLHLAFQRHVFHAYGRSPLVVSSLVHCSNNGAKCHTTNCLHQLRQQEHTEKTRLFVACPLSTKPHPLSDLAKVKTFEARCKPPTQSPPPLTPGEIHLEYETFTTRRTTVLLLAVTYAVATNVSAAISALPVAPTTTTRR